MISEKVTAIEKFNKEIVLRRDAFSKKVQKLNIDVKMKNSKILVHDFIYREHPA